ncbi:MAG: DnaB-like helicase C-terminal domain-containing protein [Candidatus Dojkabacteria bacterium]
MSNIGDWLNYEVYPSLFERVDIAFPELKFNRYRNGWRSSLKIDGTNPKQARADKTILSSKKPYCFYEQGDVGAIAIVKYIEQRDRVDFSGAIKILSQLSGIALPKNDFEQTETFRIKRVEATILEDAQGYFEHCLKTSPRASEVKGYLMQNRGYSEANIKDMELGFIPSQDKLYKYLTETKKHKAEEVKKALNFGDSKTIGSTHILTIPFREPSGQIRGFIFRPINKDFEKYGKYHYTNEKADLLFNLKAIQGDKDLIIVEGLLDALSSEAQGLKNIVALGGTSLNKTQIEEAIRRGAKRFTLLLDNDKAGREATLRALDLFNKETDLPVFVATLPEGIKDPDQLIKERGVEPLQEAINKAVKGYEYKLQHILSEYAKREEDKGELSSKDIEDFLEEVTTTAHNIKNPVDKDLFINIFLKIVEPYNISKESLQATVDKLKYKEDREAQSKEFNKLLNDVNNLNQKGDINGALELLSKQSKQLKQKDKESEYSSLLLPIKEDEVKEYFKTHNEGLKTGLKIKEHDLLLPSGALSIIAAPTSHGKTTMLINLLLNTVEEHPDKRFYLFSYEEDKNTILVYALNTYLNRDLNRDTKHGNRRAIKTYFRENTDQFIKTEYREEFKQKKDQFFNELINSQRLNIHYTDYSSEALIEAIRYLHKNTNIGGVYIDYIQLLSKEGGRYNTRQEELKRICLDLKDLSVETGLPIVLGAQFNREVTNHTLIHPTKIGEAGDIERIANLIVGLWNNNFEPLGDKGAIAEINKKNIYEPNTIYSKILKNRGGIAGIDEVLNFDGNTGKISNKTDIGF